jgi:hypothetical protein
MQPRFSPFSKHFTKSSIGSLQVFSIGRRPITFPDFAVAWTDQAVEQCWAQLDTNEHEEVRTFIAEVLAFSSKIKVGPFLNSSWLSLMHRRPGHGFHTLRLPYSSKNVGFCPPTTISWACGATITKGELPSSFKDSSFGERNEYPVFVLSSPPTIG